MKSALALLTMILWSATAHAQGSGHVGGGNQKELELKRMAFELSVYLEGAEGRRSFPEVAAYDRAHPGETVSQLLRALAIVFKPGRVLDGFDGERDCVSHFGDPRNRYVECNNDARLDPSDLNAQPGLYAFLFHEGLVQAGLEKPVSADIPSVYPISSRLRFHREVYERILPGEAPDPLSRPRKVRYFIPGWRELGYSGPAVLQIDRDQKLGRIVLDPFVPPGPPAMSAAISVLPSNRCVVLVESSHGRQSLYCDEIKRGRASGVFRRREGPARAVGGVGAEFYLPDLVASPSGYPFESYGGTFAYSNQRMTVDPIIELMSRWSACTPDRQAFTQDFRMYGPNGFRFSMGKGRYHDCDYRGRDLLRCKENNEGWVTEWHRVPPAAPASGCAVEPTPATVNPLRDWPGAVSAPDGTVWSAPIGRYQNCRGGGPGQKGHYLPDLCELDSNDSFAGTVSADGTIQESDAVAACERIGGRLPTREQFDALPADPRYWPAVESPYWKPVQYWTSTLNPDGLGERSSYGDPNVPEGRSAYVYVVHRDDSSHFGRAPRGFERLFLGVIASDNRNWLNDVRCVDR